MIGKSEIERIKAITKAKKIPESEAKEKLPISPLTQKNGSINRYKTDNVDIAIIKDNGKYTIFDYKSRKATKALALAETVAEIERLKGMVSQNEGVLPQYEALLKAEAIKEFADRLCEDRVSNDPVVISTKCLVKEMTGDAGKEDST